jgi:hypothetical protein
MLRNTIQILSLVAAVVAPSPALAGDMSYEFNLPSFGGNPNNTSYCLNLLEQQKHNFNDGSGDTSQTDFEIFQEQLRRRVLSALTSNIASSIYGVDNSGLVNPGDTSSFTFDDLGLEVTYTIVATDTGNQLCSTISDNGQENTLCIPVD